MTGLEVLDDAVKIGLGAVIATVSTYVLERVRATSARRLEANRVRQDRIIDPIVSFVDDLLIPLSEIYWSHMDNLDPDQDSAVKAENRKDDKLISLRAKEAVIDARIAALRDDDLRKKFGEFTRMYFRVRQELAEGHIAKARDLIQQTTNLAGQILNSLYALRV